MSAGVLPDAKDWKRTSVTLPEEQWVEIDALLEEVNAERALPERFSRDRFLHFLLDWATRELRAERKRKR